MKDSKLAIKINTSNPNHHLWCNNGTWWCHYWVHSLDQKTAERRRCSLHTRDMEEARQRRDRLFEDLQSGGECALPVLAA